MKIAVFAAGLLLAVSSSGAADKPPHHCAADALDKAAKLLRFHLEEDPDGVKLTAKPNEAAPEGSKQDEWYLESEVTVVSSNENTEDLEVNGGLGKVPFEMHFTYINNPDLCDLVGQSIMNE